LRAARWDEVDLEAAEWRIAAERMKMRAPHIVPLSRQAVETFAAKTQKMPLTTRRSSAMRHAARLIQQQSPNGGPFIVGEFISS
jgi:integrase